MLRYALRRAISAVPTLFGVSLVAFAITTLLPDPAGAEEPTAALYQTEPSRFDAVTDQRRARFLDLPRFFNSDPDDVRSRAERCARHLASDDLFAPMAAHQLASLGGAALPYVLPKLDVLAPAERGRVAVALAPIAQRMGLGSPDKLTNPDYAAAFWQRFWEDRSLDFTPPSVHRAVHRITLHGTELRERDLVVVDTFALSEIMMALGETDDREALARLTTLAAKATGRPHARLRANSDDAAVRGVLAGWRSWWFVHKSDYVPLEGIDRIAATIGETRYGKWMLGAASGELGTSIRDGQPIAAKLRARAPLTLMMTALAMLASYALAIPIGAFSAWRRGRAVDVALAILLFAVYSLPTFWVAQLFTGLARPNGTSALRGGFALFAPVIALSVGSLATLSRYQRSAMLDVVHQDYVRTAHAKGLSTLRVVVVHALRNAMMPTVTLAGLQFPTLLGGAFVVEEVFGLPGLGWETLRAAEAVDGAWLVVTVLLTAIVTTLAIIASDIAYGLLDPRVRESLGLRRGALP
jgi:ABC-type dipeptide/oligopeptide/nickel transport system permease component